MDTLIWNIASGILRHVLTYAGGALVTGGYLSNSDVTQAIGAIMALAAILWSAINKHRAETRVAVALATPVPDPIILSPSDPRDNTADLNRAEVKRHGG
jgi:hypothetical protein